MKELTCIVCPNGCQLKIDFTEKGMVVSGNKCKRGIAFAEAELTHPMRTICSTVKTIFKDAPVLPVRVSADIPKDKIFDVMKEINKVVIEERVVRGDIIIQNVLGLNVDVIATSSLLEEINK